MIIHLDSLGKEQIPVLLIYPSPARAAGVVVSCEIAILATRVRFPGGAHFIIPLNYEAEY